VERIPAGRDGSDGFLAGLYAEFELPLEAAG
jgi:hypothetical protein